MTPIKALAAASALMLAPAAALAQGCDYGHERQATMSCAPGSTFDADKGACVATPTG